MSVTSKSFQSPLHWGIAFNVRAALLITVVPPCFSPLFIGASRSTTFTNPLTLSTTGFQSPLHWGIAFNLPLSGVDIELELFQSPLHWGIAFNDRTPKGDDRSKAFQSPLHWGIAFNHPVMSHTGFLQFSFSPLFIGASRSTATTTCLLSTAYNVGHCPGFRKLSFCSKSPQVCEKLLL